MIEAAFILLGLVVSAWLLIPMLEDIGQAALNELF